MPEARAGKLDSLGQRIPWIAVAVFFLIPTGFLALRVVESVGLGFSPCFLKATTGFPCVTCGTTRMVHAFAAGDVAGAFHWHPVGALLVLSLPLIALWDLWRAWRRQPYPMLPDSWGLRIAVLLLILGTWVLQAVRGI